jgi:hypothetical protein
VSAWIIVTRHLADQDPEFDPRQPGSVCMAELGTALSAAGVLLAALAASVAAAEPAQILVDELQAFSRTANPEVERVGRRIWLNEAGGRRELLVHWLPERDTCRSGSAT